MDLDEGEMILIDTTIDITEQDIRHIIDISIEWEYDLSSEEGDLVYPDVKFLIKRIMDPNTHEWKSIRFTHPVRGDLEISHYGREVIEAFASSDDLPCRSLPLILFIDDFGIHRNMYRAFKGFYITPANIEYIDRRKPGNQFTLTLGPYGANMSDIVHNLEPGMSKCRGGVMININGRKTLVKAFPITITRDMLAGADNSGFYRHNTNLGCRVYKVP